MGVVGALVRPALEDGVILAGGTLAGGLRRDLERAQVCSDGLKVYFDDTYGDADFGCAGPRWTVAFALPREDLRAALDAAGEL